jgi:hypothetical protein
MIKSLRAPNARSLHTKIRGALAGRLSPLTAFAFVVLSAFPVTAFAKKPVGWLEAADYNAIDAELSVHLYGGESFIGAVRRVRDVPVTPVAFTTSVAPNAASVDTSTVYVAASLAAVHESVGNGDTSEAAFSGTLRAKLPGGGAIDSCVMSRVGVFVIGKPRIVRRASARARIHGRARAGTGVGAASDCQQ